MILKELNKTDLPISDKSVFILSQNSYWKEFRYFTLPVKFP